MRCRACPRTPLRHRTASRPPPQFFLAPLRGVRPPFFPALIGGAACPPALTYVPPCVPPLFLFHHGSSLRAIVLYLPLIVVRWRDPCPRARRRRWRPLGPPPPPRPCTPVSVLPPSLSPFPHLTPASARWPPLQFFDYTPFLRFPTMFLSPCRARGPAAVRPICPQRPRRPPLRGGGLHNNPPPVPTPRHPPARRARAAPRAGASPCRRRPRALRAPPPAAPARRPACTLPHRTTPHARSLPAVAPAPASLPYLVRFDSPCFAFTLQTTRPRATHLSSGFIEQCALFTSPTQVSLPHRHDFAPPCTAQTRKAKKTRKPTPLACAAVCTPPAFSGNKPLVSVRGPSPVMCCVCAFVK